MRRVLCLAAALAAAPAAGSAPAAAPSAQEVVKETSSHIIAALRERNAEVRASPERLYDFVEAYVLPHFDFDRMARLVLGKYWRSASADERRQFTDEFRYLLVRTYASAMLDYSGEEIVYLPFRGASGTDDVTVRTEVALRGTAPIPIEYSLYLRDGAWKVYDVTIDGVSLVVNYRSTFAAEIRRQGSLAGLIARLRERNRPGAQ